MNSTLIGAILGYFELAGVVSLLSCNSLSHLCLKLGELSFSGWIGFDDLEQVASYLDLAIRSFGKSLRVHGLPLVNFLKAGL